MIDAERRKLKKRQRRAKRAERPAPTAPEFVFFHIGKTGGGSIRSFLDPVSERCAMVGHKETLSTIQSRWPGAPMTFFARDPMTWFVSGFNNFRRAVEEKPELKLPGRDDLIAFHLFPTANDLAEALVSDDDRTLSAAHWAVSTLAFLRRPLTKSIGGGPEEIDRHLPQMPLICLFEKFDRSMDAMRVAFNLPPDLPYPPRVHQGLNHVPKHLSELGRRGISEWYRADIELYEHCRAIHERQARELLGEA